LKEGLINTFVYIYNNSKTEAMDGYNDDLVISFGIALWIRDTALRLRAEGIELQKKAISGITMNPHPSVSDHFRYIEDMVKLIEKKL